MCDVFANHKRITLCVIVFAVLALFTFASSSNFLVCSTAYAEETSDVERELENNLNETLDNIDSSQLDEYLDSDIGLELFNVFSFKELVSLVLDGELFSDYNSLIDIILSRLKEYFSAVLKILIVLLSLVLLYKVFNSFCSDKYDDIKKVVKLIFVLSIVLILVFLMKDLSENIKVSINKVFGFCEILFPILLSLVLSSGATVSYASYNSLSVVLLGTASYVFMYVLVPISVSIMVLGLACSVSSKNNLGKVADILKTIFKYIVIGIIGVFGIFSSISIISSGMKDGLSLRLTKYAIKNYVPVLGGYISDGFDFIKGSSVIIKNAFGVCGVVVIFFMVLSPLLTYITYLLAFKILSAVVSFLGEEKFANIFDGVSKSVSYFVAVLLGVFLIFFVFIYMIILSVSVV